MAWRNRVSQNNERRGGNRVMLFVEIYTGLLDDGSSNSDDDMHIIGSAEDGGMMVVMMIHVT